MIRPHMLQSIENARFFSELECKNRALDSRVDEPGRATVLFNAEGTILFRNRRACLCMERWFESRGVSREVVNQTLRSWVSSQLRYSNELKLNNFGAVWTLEKEERSLSVRLTLGNNPGEYILLLDEKEKLNPATLKTRFGLTTREAEVLHWVAQAKRNGEIAIILGITERTVQKHMERILATLGVENRTAAANVAREFL
jgi:DNA-binding CsgD family transcriptional regulator